MRPKWYFEISIICISTLTCYFGNQYYSVYGVHLNKKVQNLSIESSGKLLVNDNNRESPSEEESSTGPDSANNESSSTITNINTNTSTSTGSTSSTSANKTTSDSKGGDFDDEDDNTNKYTEYNGTLDWESVVVKDGIAYDAETGLPILPDMSDGFEHEYDYRGSITANKSLSDGIAWIIIFSCIILLVIMIIVITIVSCVRHRRNRRRRENENNSSEVNFNDNQYASEG
ncbi:hypothetical protein FG379_002805 [Cryptosporidium bovis]|uniref:uncharacterized protein n=1 Tax=Cryptosporidium bovis TaxID=310047 RepID=UPI00351A7DF7|nr:hypothetical protein FG379_002805 [Cryptosporidium bovis]